MPASQGELAHLFVTQLLMPDPDIRPRTLGEYIDYLHSRMVPDVKLRGVVVPLIVYREGDKYRVGDGGTRLQAALLAGIEKVPCICYPSPLTPGDNVIASLMANAMRLDQSDREKAVLYLGIMQDKGWSQAELCRQLHLDKSAVCRSIKRLSLPDDILADVPEKIKPRGADALATLKDHPDVMREYADKLRTGAWSVETVEDKARNLLDGRKPKKAKPQTIKDAGVVAQFPPAWTETQIVEWLLSWAKKLRPKTA